MSVHPRNVTATSHARDLRTQRLGDKSPMWGIVRRVTDGDTLVVEIYPEDTDLSRLEYVRIAGLDAPELKGPDPAAALAARRYLVDLCQEKLVLVTPTRLWRDPYHRIIARVVVAHYAGVTVSFPPLNDVCVCMIASGLAKRRTSTTRSSLATHSAGTPPLPPVRP